VWSVLGAGIANGDHITDPTGHGLDETPEKESWNGLPLLRQSSKQPVLVLGRRWTRTQPPIELRPGVLDRIKVGALPHPGKNPELELLLDRL